MATRSSQRGEAANQARRRANAGSELGEKRPATAKQQEAASVGAAKRLQFAIPPGARATNWRLGVGYPSKHDPLGVWEYEFLRRGKGFATRTVFRPVGEMWWTTDEYPIQHQLDLADETQVRNRVLLEFATDRDLSMQLKKAASYLRAVQKLRHGPAVARRHINVYGMYLRVLDAEAEGASVEEIAKVLHPHKSRKYAEKNGQATVRDHLAAARRLAAAGFGPPERRQKPSKK